MHAGDQRLLFLCTGNYYRSRFAEALWNHSEGASPTGWSADSRGLCTALGLGNVGPISQHALRGLRARGIHLRDPIRSPQQVDESDFASANRVVAVCAAEHRPMMLDLFPRWAEAVEYWDVEDVDFCPVDTALASLESHVRDLRAKLS